MRADVQMVFSFLTVVIVVGLLVRFGTGASKVATSVLTGFGGIVTELENPGRFEQKVGS